MDVPSGEATHTPFIVFSLARWHRKPTIYCIQIKHSNNYTTDAVQSEIMSVAINVDISL